jgi:cell division protein FtsZ
MRQAEAGIEALSPFVDSLIVIPNERLKQISENKITLFNAFAYADDVLRHGVQSISDLISSHGIVNLDFADVSSVMKEAGYAHMGVGEGKGKDKAEVAAKMAVTSPLLETAISGATGILINITASPDISLDEVETASALVSSEAHPDATIIWGLAFDERLDDTIKVTVIATGFEDAGKKATTDMFRTAAFSQTSNTASMNRYNTTQSTPKFSTENMDRYSAIPNTAETRVPTSNVTDIMNILNNKKRY